MRVMDDGRTNPMGSRGDEAMAFKESAGQFLADVLRAALRATIGLTVLVWAIFGLWLSYQLVRHLVSFLSRTAFTGSW